MNDPKSDKNLGDDPSIHRTASVRASTFGRFCEVGARTKVAESSFGDYAYVVNDSDIIYTTVGKFCSIAAHTRINPGNHPLKRVALSHFTYRSSSYGMGPDDAAFFEWRRSFRCVMGNGAAIGAGAVVSKDVPPFAIVVGTPGKVLRYRFSPEIIAALERISWWDWSHEQLRVGLPDFRTMSAEDFCRKYDPA
jgi:acetyltransferase-like isoleucine patch superfamily enzyme